MEPAEAFTITEYCARAKISRAHYYNERKKGLGPKQYRDGTKPLISRHAAEEYQAALEEAAE